ncbi:MAG: PHB depolymerase family esterase [Pseudobdellovibrio sp.]
MLFILLQTSYSEANSLWQKANLAGLDYLIYVPTHIDTKPLSLMINLHGCGQHAKDLANLGNWEVAAEDSRMIVVLPDVPNGGVVMGCWDYYGKNHTETNRHNGPLIELTESLIKMENLNINTNHVFISGLSSGAGEAAILGCLRPDLFSGVALNSGPALGTTQNDLYLPTITSDEIAEQCNKLAGSRSIHFLKQITSIMVSDKDLIVNPQHSALSFEAIQKIYGLAGATEFDLTKLKGTNTQGIGLSIQDKQNQIRISFITNHALGHAFPSGKGTGPVEHYINPFSINYPAYLGNLFKR